MDVIFVALTLSYIILKNGQIQFLDLAMLTPQNFKSMFGHFSTLCMKRLILPFNKYLPNGENF